MSIVFEIIWQVVFEWLLGAPGAFILWALRGFKGAFSNILAENPNKSAAIGFCFWVAVIATSKYLI